MNPLRLLRLEGRSVVGWRTVVQEFAPQLKPDKHRRNCGFVRKTATVTAPPDVSPDDNVNA
jgi:hypothetical protein